MNISVGINVVNDTIHVAVPDTGGLVREVSTHGNHDMVGLCIRLVTFDKRLKLLYQLRNVVIGAIGVVNPVYSELAGLLIKAIHVKVHPIWWLIVIREDTRQNISVGHRSGSIPHQIQSFEVFSVVFILVVDPCNEQLRQRS